MFFKVQKMGVGANFDFTAMLDRIFIGYSWDIHRVFICVGYVSVMYRLCVGYVSVCRACEGGTNLTKNRSSYAQAREIL